MSGIERYVDRAERAEKAIAELQRELELSDLKNDVDMEILENLRVENSKLKYRLNILERATRREELRKHNK
jgi:regulator of replication initiation timing